MIPPPPGRTLPAAAPVREPKRDYLRRIMLHGSAPARTLKRADRISNLTALGFVHDVEFVKRYLEETRDHVLPYAETVNPNMFRELSDLIENRTRLLPLVSPPAGTAAVDLTPPLQDDRG